MPVCVIYFGCLRTNSFITPELQSLNVRVTAAKIVDCGNITVKYRPVSLKGHSCVYFINLANINK
jgi:hypothetical protein